jgi:hypothetical protein
VQTQAAKKLLPSRLQQTAFLRVAVSGFRESISGSLDLKGAELYVDCLRMQLPMMSEECHTRILERNIKSGRD